MKPLLTMTGAILLFVAQPVWAQQGQSPNTAPSRASPQGASNPLLDPFKDGGKPESHGGTVHAPHLNAGRSGAASFSAEMRPAVEVLARTTITAQQYGNLASKRHTSGAVHDLGDRMVITNNRIIRTLSAAAPGSALSEPIPAEERGTFDNLARNADEVQFGVSVAQWVAQSYPRTINTLEQIAQSGDLKEMASSALPDLRSQLADAQRILQEASSAPNGQPLSTGTVGQNTPAKQSD